MPRAMPEVEKISKEIMIAYIQSLGVASEVLFRKPGKEHQQSLGFDETWEQIVKTVSGQNPHADTH